MADTADEAELRGLIAQWSKAVRDRDTAGIRANHDPDILMFDVPPAFLVSWFGRLHGDVGRVLRLASRTGAV